MFRRRRLPLIAGWMLAIMFFSQAALALSSCLGDRLPAQAFASGEAKDCCAEAEGGMKALAHSANACLAHCTADAQNVDTQHSVMPQAPLQAVLLVQTPVPPQWLALGHAIARDVVPPAPPPLILFKHFLI